ncbi:hypothetical protein GGX14DRAFT_543674 [Mycena pura]|uniref:Uncharacterized protein n=1 Tax=Mycena pura TaxID=153505 RepID=A0AAD6VA18_9AGAR|nr:hypothetical protein GGX14DRAFT_543674 [Mycena pura]
MPRRTSRKEKRRYNTAFIKKFLILPWVSLPVYRTEPVEPARWARRTGLGAVRPGYRCCQWTVMRPILIGDPSLGAVDELRVCGRAHESGLPVAPSRLNPTGSGILAIGSGFLALSCWRPMKVSAFFSGVTGSARLLSPFSGLRDSQADGDSLSLITTTDKDTPETHVDSAATLLHVRKGTYQLSASLPPWFDSGSSLTRPQAAIATQVIQKLVPVVLDSTFDASCHPSGSPRNLPQASRASVYSTALVFITQVLSTRRNLIVNQTLTATHDAVAAWAGLGSAMTRMWKQRAVHASAFGVLSAFLYLGNILVLHITIPALFSLQSFNSSRSVPVATQSFPEFNSSVYDLSTQGADPLMIVYMYDYAHESLSSLPSALQSATALGLSGGTLYDVLEPNPGKGNVTVNAMGFNVTCSYVTDFDTEFHPETGSWNVKSKNGTQFTAMEPTDRGIISSLAVPFGMRGLFLYSTAQIVDSSGDPAFQTELSPRPTPIDTQGPVHTQILACSQSLVSQQAVVDAQSRQLIVVTPNITKTSSTWPLPVIYPEAEWEMFGTSSLMDMADQFYVYAPESSFGRDSIAVNDERFSNLSESSLSVADIFLSQQLNLITISDLPQEGLRVNLHALENVLAGVFASMIWTCNVHIPQWYADVVTAARAGESTPRANTSNPFCLLQGNATVTQEFTQTRLDLSEIAVIGGLAASVVLTLLTLPFAIFHKDRDDIMIDGVGILHAIWAYRNHPELEILLEQVEHPTEDNLREAGMGPAGGPTDQVTSYLPHWEGRRDAGASLSPRLARSITMIL